MKKKIVFLNKFPKKYIYSLKKIKKIQFITSIKKTKSSVNAILSFKRQSFDKLFKRNFLREFKNLEWVHFPFAGLENYESLKRYSKVKFTSVNQIQSIQVAEHAIGMLLSISRKISYLLNYGIKSKFDFLPFELNNKKILIFGYGAIGKSIKKKLIGFDTKISILTNKKIKKTKDIFKIYPIINITKAFNENDIIFISIPLNKSNQSIITFKELNSLKKNSIIISISRENIFDLKALYNFSKKKINKKISFGLDFFCKNFIKENKLLSKQKNILLTPHIAGVSDSYNDRHLNFLIKNLKKYYRGEQLNNLVFRK